MRRILIAIMAVLLMAGMSTVAHADSPHFLKATSSIDNAGNLLCTFKEAGLGGTATSADIMCSANATAVYECVNNGGHNPAATNKETVSGPVSGGGSFPIRNGSASGTITVAPPGPGGFSCPGGQHLVLASVTYTGITVSGEGATAATSPSSQTFTNPSAP